jgi:hypothetical protein
VTQTRPIADRSQYARPPARMTSRGVIVAMFALFFIGALIADLLHFGFLVGFSFLVGCVLAARYARRSALLTAVVSPPLIFLIAVICAEGVSSSGPTAHAGFLSAAEGTILTLASTAPWLFAGELLGLALALFRGLPQCIGDLRAGLRGEDMRHTAID